MSSVATLLLWTAHTLPLAFRVLSAGIVKRVGRSDAFATEFDLEAEDFVPVPKGQVEKRKEVVQTVSLHDLDVANSKPQVRSEQFY